MAVVQGIEPRDEIEGMLAAQMAAIHIATMLFARNLTCAERCRSGTARGTLNKLARTFATQMEALKRYRRTASRRSRCSTNSHR